MSLRISIEGLRMLVIFYLHRKTEEIMINELLLLRCNYTDIDTDIYTNNFNTYRENEEYRLIRLCRKRV